MNPLENSVLDFDGTTVGKLPADLKNEVLQVLEIISHFTALTVGVKKIYYGAKKIVFEGGGRLFTPENFFSDTAKLINSVLGRLYIHHIESTTGNEITAERLVRLKRGVGIDISDH